MAALAEDFRVQGKTLVHCHGVFDFVHIGHIDYFEQAKQLGDVVYVSIIADRFVRKGPDRPRFPQDIRLSWVAGIEAVDMKLILRATALPNPCKRDGGTYHGWGIFEATKWRGEVNAGSDASEAVWVSLRDILDLIGRTFSINDQYGLSDQQLIENTHQLVRTPEWQESPGLEPVWCSHVAAMIELGTIRLPA